MPDMLCPSDIPPSPSMLPPQCRRMAVAMGIFDGVHLGHQKLISRLACLAASSGSTPVALFFHPHPSEVLGRGAPPVLTGLQAKSELLLVHGAARLVCVPFTRELAMLPPESFLESFFRTDGIEVTSFCVGSDWRFGCGNKGDAGTLRRWAEAHGSKAEIIGQVLMDGVPVSSTRIREAVASGRLAEAERMLGRPYSISGLVRHGNGIGSTRLSCPTANLATVGLALPPFGVYAARARWEGRCAGGIVYVGEAPTIRDAAKPEVLAEIHLFDVDEDLYGRRMSVEFLGFLRPSIRFASAEELGRQIEADIARAREMLASGTGGGQP